MGGEPKGLLRIGGPRIIDRVAAALAGAADEVILVANAPDADRWLPGVTVVSDKRPGFGPLSGIHAALNSSPSDLLVLSWDAPFVPGDLLRALREAGEMHDAAIAAPQSRAPWGFEPLCAWYSAESLPAVEAQLDAGDGHVGSLKDHAKLLTVDVSSWGDPDELFLNVNTPDDLMRAEKLAKAGR
jgi:molybdopterin-guanine dinucleotide biosynthesis protein A